MEFKINSPGLIYGDYGEITCTHLATKQEISELRKWVARTQKIAQRQNRLRRRGFRK